MSNSTLFLQAHKMTRLTIQKGYTYRETFGKWLSFLTTGVTNYIRPSSVNKDCAMIPVLQHDKEDKFSYKLSLPLTLTRYKQNGYSEWYRLDRILIPYVLVLSLIINIYFLIF